MAFTPEQEAKLINIIAAFDNGKRLNELPVVGGSANPFDLISEVLDSTDGENKQAKLAELLPYMEDQCAYGVEFDTTISSPICTRIGNSDLHKSLPVQSRMKGCLLKNDGSVQEYLNPLHWGGHDLSGARGQVMVEIPMHYRKCVTDGNKRRVLISEYPLPGYHAVEMSYVSAYEATVQRSTTTLCSVKNTDADFRGGANQSTWDDTSKSVLGRPASSIGRQTFRAYARKRKADSSEWNCNVYEQYKAIYWLFVTEYATLNSQSDFNAELTSEGYKQGGLGDGATTLSSSQWGAFNSSYPFIPCGHTDELGNQSGEVAYEMPTEYSETPTTIYANRYRGIENPFGHIYKWTDGINVDTQSPEDGGLSKVYVATDPAVFNDSNYDGYEHRGNQPRTDGYGKKHIFGEKGDIIAAEVGGGSTTYMCDYLYTLDYGLRGVMLGGATNHGSRAGFSYSASIYAPSFKHSHVGSRLCFIPKNE